MRYLFCVGDSSAFYSQSLLSKTRSKPDFDFFALRMDVDGPEDEVLKMAPPPCASSWLLPSDNLNSWRGLCCGERRLCEGKVGEMKVEVERGLLPPPVWGGRRGSWFVASMRGGDL